MNYNVLAREVVDGLDYTAIKFNIMGDDFYCVTKNRYGETGLTKDRIDESKCKNGALITDFNELNSKQKESFIHALIETIS